MASWRRVTGVLMCVGVVIVPASASFASATGSLDPTFGDGGIVVTRVGPRDDGATSVAVQTDGRIVVAGYRVLDSTQSPQWAVTRYQADGTLDSSFSQDGFVGSPKPCLDSGESCRSRSVAVQADGKIVVAGTGWDPVGSHVVIARYDPDGSLDTTFDGDGVVIQNLGLQYVNAGPLVIQADGRILVAAEGNADLFVTRFHSDGSLDESFDGDGISSWALAGVEPSVRGIAVQTDGRVVIGGGVYAYNPPETDSSALWRFNVDGSLDATFDGDGVVTTLIGAGSQVTDVAIQGDGRIIASGYSSSESPQAQISYFALARYNPDGSLDVTFDGDGLVTTSFPIGIPDWGGSAEANALGLQSDGKILAAGSAWDGAQTAIALARYDSDGQLDDTFGIAGQTTAVFGAPSGGSYVADLAIQPDSRIVTVGSAYNGSNEDFALARFNGDSGGTAATWLSIKAPTSVMAGSKARITGRLSSADPACATGRDVYLKKGGVTLGPKMTDDSGRYSFRSAITVKAVVQVTFAGTAGCSPSASAKKTIGVT
jgi:uncharacterized delta-60 repeat protein